MQKTKEMIGSRIKELRLSNTALSQEDFCKDLGMNRSFFSRIESGKQNITLETLLEICAKLGVSLSEFFSPFNQRIED